MPAIAPSGPGEVVAPKETSVVTMIDRFKSRMAEEKAAPAKPAEKPPEKPTAIAPTTPPPAKPEPKQDSGPKPVVPKLEPLPEKKPEPAKPTEPFKPEGEPIPEKLSHKNFKEVLSARDEFKTKYEAAEKRAKEFEAKLQEQSTRKPPELEEAEKQLAEYRQYVQQYDLEHSTEFQNAFDKPIAQTIQDAKDMLGGERGERLEKILRAPDDDWRNARIKEFVSDLEDDFDKGTVRDAFSALKKLQRGRKEELLKAGENLKVLKQLNAKRAEDQMAKVKEQRMRLADMTLDAASKSLTEFRETDDATHNATVSENKSLLKSFLTDDLPPEEFGRMAVWAVRGYRSLATERALSEKVAALEAEIQKLSAASPDLDSGGGSGERTDKADTPEKMGERFMRATSQGIPGR